MTIGEKFFAAIDPRDRDWFIFAIRQGAPPIKGLYPSDFGRVQQANREEDANAFYVVSRGGTRNDEIVDCPCVFADFDSASSPDDILGKIEKLPAPTAIVFSGRGYHVYWRLTEPATPEVFSRIQRGIATLTGSDPVVSNPGRQLRIPGTINPKNGKTCEVVQFAPENESKAGAFPQEEEKREEGVSAYSAARGMAPVAEGSRNDTLFRYACDLRNRGLRTDEALTLLHQTNNGFSQPLPSHEVLSIYNSSQRYAARLLSHVEQVPIPARIPEEVKGVGLGSTPGEAGGNPLVTAGEVSVAKSTGAPHSIDPGAPNKTFPGLPHDSIAGRVARYLQGLTVECPNEIIEATAIGFISALLGNRVIGGDTGISSNLFLTCLAPSGSGKTEAVKAVSRLTRDDLDLERFLLGNPASDAGLLDSLSSEGGNRRLLLWDEFGRKLHAINKNRNSASHERNLLSTAMELFSVAGSRYLDKVRANNQRGRKDAEEREIVRPHLSVLAFSTPDTFVESLDVLSVEDGFLPRFLFVSANPTTPKLRSREGKLLPKLPESLYRELLHINAIPEYSPLKIMMTGDAFDLWARYEYRSKLAPYDPFTPIRRRQAEQVLRLALCLLPEYNMKTLINSNLINWCISFVDKSTDYVESLLKPRLDTPFTRDDAETKTHHQRAQKVLDFLRDNPRAKRSLLLRKTIRPAKALDSALSDLVASGEVIKETDGSTDLFSAV